MSESSDTRKQGEEAAMEDLELTTEDAAEVGGGTDFVISHNIDKPSVSLPPPSTPPKIK